MNQVLIPDAGIHPAVWIAAAFIIAGVGFVLLMRSSINRAQTRFQLLLGYVIIVLLASLPLVGAVTYYTLDHDVAAKTALKEEAGVTRLSLTEKNKFRNLRCDLFTSTGAYGATWVQDEEPHEGTLKVSRYTDGTCGYELIPGKVVKG